MALRLKKSTVIQGVNMNSRLILRFKGGGGGGGGGGAMGIFCET